MKPNDELHGEHADKGEREAAEKLYETMKEYAERKETPTASAEPQAT